MVTAADASLKDSQSRCTTQGSDAPLRPRARSRRDAARGVADGPCVWSSGGAATHH
jgi:hypothetical protein